MVNTQGFGGGICGFHIGEINLGFESTYLKILGTKNKIDQRQLFLLCLTFDSNFNGGGEASNGGSS